MRLEQMLFSDSILLSILTRQRPFIITSTRTLGAIARPRIRKCMSNRTIAGVFCVLHQRINDRATHRLLSELLRRLRVTDIASRIVETTLRDSVTSFRSTIADTTTGTTNLRIVIAQGTPSFITSTVPTMLPRRFLTVPLRWKLLASRGGRTTPRRSVNLIRLRGFSTSNRHSHCATALNAWNLGG